MKALTERQQKVLDFIEITIARHGYPPTIREIGQHMDIPSTNAVNDHLRALEKKGYLLRTGMKSRALRPISRLSNQFTEAPSNHPETQQATELDSQLGNQLSARPGGPASAAASRDNQPHATQSNPRSPKQPLSTSEPTNSQRDLSQRATSQRPASQRAVSQRRAATEPEPNWVNIPILGRVAAGLPLEAIEQPEDNVCVDRVLLGGAREVFGLRIQGESMIDAGIHNGDYVFVRKQLEARRGDVVVALVGDEATCKYYFPENDHIRLQPANDKLAPIYVPRTDWRTTQILGVVIGLYRRF